MQLQKRFSALFLVICLILAMSMTAYAAETPDMTRTGSVSVSMTCDGKAVPGGTLTLYQVGAINEDDGNYSFVLTGDFEKSGILPDDISSAALASSLAAYASSGNLNGKTADIGNDGKATVDSLRPGLYLVIQTKAADGYEAIEPFLVSVPMNEEGTYVYDVDATPKLSMLRKGTPSVPAVTPSVPTAAPPKTSATTLPQTGQLNWPIPVLTAIGLCLFLTGWELRFGKKGRVYEA